MKNNNNRHLSEAINKRESSCHDGEEGVDDGKDQLVATPDMCHYCFDTLLAELLPDSDPRGQGRSPKRKHTTKTTITTTSHDGSRYSNNHDTNTPASVNPRHQQQTYTPPNIDCPLFVTWSKLRSKHPPPLLSEVSSSGLSTPVTTTASTSNITDDEDDGGGGNNVAEKVDYDLRGCVGTLSPKSLKYALSEFTVTSALHDHRFDPISLSELPFLRVGVSLLVKYEVCDHCLDWEVGVHGIIIKFDIAEGNGGGRGDYSATYLPEVAYEQKWTQQETVISLVRKAGYRGVITDELLVQIRCTRYQSSKHQLSYQEHVMVMHRGIDPLQGASINLAAAAVDEAMRQTGNSSRHCVNL